jgi:acetolactate synthase-1/3 small subunit
MTADLATRAPRQPSRHHVVSLLVENKAGVLVRVAGLFARRGFNIYSLAVAPTDDEAFSRIVIVVDVESSPLQQVLDQLDKLINVVQISELHPKDALQAELLLATVSSADPAALEAAVSAHGATILERSGAHVAVMLAGEPEDLDRFEDEIRTIGILELQRTGRIAIPKPA